MSNFEVALQFEDGVTRFIHVIEGEILLDAAYRQQINIPLDCRDGACGTCRAFCEAGSYEMDADYYIEEALSAEEAAKGYVLACQCQPTSNGIYHIQSASTLCKISAYHYEGTIVSLAAVSDSTFILQLTVDKDAPLIEFLAGQYVNLEIPGSNGIRAYSFSSAPKERILEFIIRNVPLGLMSQYLSLQAKKGDKIKFIGPYGSFYLRDLVRPALFLAGGTGIAPFKSMLADLVAKNNQMPVKLIYGVTYEADLVLRNFLEMMAKDHGWFTYQAVVVNGESSHAKKGYVTDHIDVPWLTQQDFDLYLCGPIAMVDAVQHWLAQMQITPAHFYYERFTPNATGGSDA